MGFRGMLPTTRILTYNHFVDFQTNEFIVVNHSRLPDYENIHGIHLDTNAKCCPFPTAFLWHECRVRGYHPIHGDRPVAIKRCVIRGSSGGHDVGVHGDGDRIGSTGAGEQVGQHDADTCVPQDTNAMTFTPMRLEADTLALWLQAARQHSSWKGCVDENAPWDGTAEGNIEKYERQVGILV